MHRSKLILKEAFLHVKEKRPFVGPNQHLKVSTVFVVHSRQFFRPKRRNRQFLIFISKCMIFLSAAKIVSIFQFFVAIFDV